MSMSHPVLHASWRQEAMDRLNQALTTGTPPVALASRDLDDIDVFRVTLAGPIDLVEEAGLNALVEDFRNAEMPSARVDLRQVTFMDSAGLGFLERLRRVALERGGNVTLVGPSGICLRALQLVRFDEVFPMHG
jgi:anti-anti-sigma factor